MQSRVEEAAERIWKAGAAHSALRREFTFGELIACLGFDPANSALWPLYMKILDAAREWLAACGAHIGEPSLGFLVITIPPPDDIGNSGEKRMSVPSCFKNDPDLGPLLEQFANTVTKGEGDAY